MDIKAFIESGILEGYVLDAISDEDKAVVEEMLTKHSELKTELTLIEKSLAVYTEEYSLTPPSHIRNKIIADIKNFDSPPILNQNSKIEDYKLWLNNVKAPENYENMHMEVIGEYEEAKMVIAWIKKGEPNHLHTDYNENFLIVEGTCTATIDGVTKNYGAGDYVSFPINKHHGYEITSNHPMRVIACLDLKAA